MKVLIIEDEVLAAEGLIAQINRFDPNIQVIEVLDSVQSAVQWFQTHELPDVVFMDIHLADGLSFEIFEQIQVACPVIFTTAYDAYALRAFKVNSIDYLLKPVGEEELKKSFEKLRHLQGAGNQPGMDLHLLRQMLLQHTPAYKTRFMVKVGDKLATYSSAEIDFFWGEHKVVWMRLQNGRKYMIDYTLEELEEMLDPTQFFRLNRSFIATYNAIKEVLAYSNSRLKVVLKEAPDKEDILISREKAEAFRIWLGK
jgi:DNA-binding LytR/AlgR family response regulator